MKTNNLSQQYRPQNLKDLIGQNHIVEAIKRTIKTQSFSSLYIFFGERGTGKTTSARLFAKAANCKNILEETGCCNKCANCLQEIGSEFSYFLEIDGSSCRNVDKISFIKDMSVSGISTNTNHRFIVIDEAQSIKKDAFDCMLKAFEENAHNTSFILITTEIDKIPTPIKSRAVSFQFKNIAKDSIEKKLEKICEEQNIKTEEGAIQEITLKASGSMRDAESILQSVFVSRENESSISKKDVFSNIGKIDISKLRFIDECKENNNQEVAVRETAKLWSLQHSPYFVFEAFVSHFYNILLALHNTEDLIKEIKQKNYYLNIKTLYVKKEIENILFSLLNIENKFLSNSFTSQGWLVLIVQKIIDGSYRNERTQTQTSTTKKPPQETVVMQSEKTVARNSSSKRDEKDIEIVHQFAKKELRSKKTW